MNCSNIDIKSAIIARNGIIAALCSVFFSIIFSVAFAFIISGCRGDKDPDPDPSVDPRYLETYTVVFDIDGGSPEVHELTVKGGELIPRPTERFSKDYIPVGAGLYRGLADLYSLGGWYTEDGTEWNFIIDTVFSDLTLKARWVEPIIDVSEEGGNTDVAKAFNYVKNRPGTYTIILGDDVALTPQMLNVSNLKITLVGWESERKITQQVTPAYAVLFDLRSNVELTLGNNITLEGGTNNLVYVYQQSIFTMLDGSKITGNTSFRSAFNAAVLVEHGTMNMKGGSITGNHSTGLGSGGGIYMGSTATVNLEGGTVSGNTSNREPCDVFMDGTSGNNVNNTCRLTVLESSEVEALTMVASSTTTPAVTVASGWTGKVNALNLGGDDRSNMPTSISFWANSTVLKPTDNYSLTAADVSKFTLGKFIATSFSGAATQTISDTHRLGDEGEDMGKLVAK